MMFGHLGASAKADVDERNFDFFPSPVSCCFLVPGLGFLGAFVSIGLLG